MPCMIRNSFHTLKITLDDYGIDMHTPNNPLREATLVVNHGLDSNTIS